MSYDSLANRGGPGAVARFRPQIRRFHLRKILGFALLRRLLTYNIDFSRHLPPTPKENTPPPPPFFMLGWSILENKYQDPTEWKLYGGSYDQKYCVGRVGIIPNGSRPEVEK